MLYLNKKFFQIIIFFFKNLKLGAWLRNKVRQILGGYLILSPTKTYIQEIRA